MSEKPGIVAVALAYHSDNSGFYLIGVYASELEAQAALGRLSIQGDRGLTTEVRVMDLGNDHDLEMAKL